LILNYDEMLFKKISEFDICNSAIEAAFSSVYTLSILKRKCH
jgi:hypothetical protein